MDSKIKDLPNQYKILQEAVDQSSLHTTRQLKTISGNSYIGACILLVLALGITYYLNIFQYWIPAGFALFYFLFFTGLRSMQAPFLHKDIKDVLKHHKEKHKEIRARIDSSIQKNLSIIMQAIAILYLISFFILLSIQYNWIVIEQTINPILPGLTCLLFLPVPFFIKEFHRLLKPSDIYTSHQQLLKQHKANPLKAVFSITFLKPFFFGFYLGVLLILPLLSFGFISNIITQWPYLVLIFLLQCFIVVLFANSFSANIVRKELTTTITSYADLSYLLSMAQIQNHYTTAEYNRLQTLYQSAKPYDFTVQDTFKFMNYYMLIPNRFHLKEILKHPQEPPVISYDPTPPSIKHQPTPPPPPPPQKQPTQPTPTPTAKPQTSRPAFMPTAQKPQTQEPVSEPQDEKYKKIDDIKLGKMGILLYGPMLDHLTPEIKEVTKRRIRRVTTPFKVELARKNETYAGAPGLVPVNTGGVNVDGEILVFNDEVTERQALDMLYRMENHLDGTKKSYRKPSNPTQNVFVIKTLPNFYGIEKVFYPSIGRNINQINPKKLAKLTIDSVFNADEKDPDGFSYLMSLKKHGISTPMSEACEQEILHQTFSNSLMQSRKKLEEVNTIKSSID